MSRRPPTWGTTARLALLGLTTLLCHVAGHLYALGWLVLNAAPESLPAALVALGAIAGPALLAHGAIATGGAAIHGARHIGGDPAPTSAELAALPQPPEV
jgi:hypothetical protein